VGRLVSGGQTGVDRAALDVALRLGIPCGGWCPAGRWAEDGPIPPLYPLRETPSADPAQRTAWNVRDSDATLILLRGEAAGGTKHTLDEARSMNRPLFIHDLGAPPTLALAAWLESAAVRTLNVAGPRESECPGIYAEAFALLFELLYTRG
jgi:hypothetical protein